jgi:hypothetical protein
LVFRIGSTLGSASTFRVNGALDVLIKHLFPALDLTDQRGGLSDINGSLDPMVLFAEIAEFSFLVDLLD